MFLSLLIVLLIEAVLLLAHLLLGLWKERDNLRAMWWRWLGKPARERIAAQQTEADRRAAVLAAKEQQNFMDYDGDEQPEIDITELVDY